LLADGRLDLSEHHVATTEALGASGPGVAEDAA
jgi:hypothetical protein